MQLVFDSIRFRDFVQQGSRQIHAGVIYDEILEADSRLTPPLHGPFNSSNDVSPQSLMTCVEKVQHLFSNLSGNTSLQHFSIPLTKRRREGTTPHHRRFGCTSGCISMEPNDHLEMTLLGRSVECFLPSFVRSVSREVEEHIGTLDKRPKSIGFDPQHMYKPMH